MGGFENFVFKYGKALNDANVYFFENEKQEKLAVSEKIGKFQNGEKSQYLLFEYYVGDEIVINYIDRKSQEFLSLTNIRSVVDDLGNTVQCKGCNHIVLKENITNAKGDTCVYCDKYACKKCRKMKPLIELDENRLCEKCRNEK